MTFMGNKTKIILTISSIFINVCTVSEANVTALILTRRGWTTFSSKIFVTEPYKVKNNKNMLQMKGFNIINL